MTSERVKREKKIDFSLEQLLVILIIFLETFRKTQLQLLKRRSLGNIFIRDYNLKVNLFRIFSLITFTHARIYVL